MANKLKLNSVVVVPFSVRLRCIAG